MFPNHLKRYQILSDPFMPRAIDDSKVSRKNSVIMDPHFANVIHMYNSLFELVADLPSYHVGYLYATEKLAEIGERYGLAQSHQILELCCGLGASARYLANTYGCRVIGLDINLRQATECQHRSRKDQRRNFVSVCCGNAIELPFRNETFDFIWSEDAFSHIPTRQRLFNECFRVLRPNGTLLFSDLLRTSKMTEVEERKHMKAWCLAFLETIESYPLLLQKANFTVHERISIGYELIMAHEQCDAQQNDAPSSVYIEWLESNAQQIISLRSQEDYDLRRERLNFYSYLKNGKLDYGFFLAKKCDRRIS